MSTQKKQRWVGIALVVTLIFLGWQVSGLMHSDVRPAPTASKATPHRETKNQVVSSQAPAPAAVKWEKSMLTSASEKQYLQLAAEIQRAKMHRQLLQQQVAIAVAKKKLALSHQQTARLSAGSDDLASWARPGALSDGLSLVYLAKIADGRWEATLQRNGEFLHVVNGSDLGHGTRVFSITANGLWIQEQGHPKVWLGFSGDLAAGSRHAVEIMHQ